MYAFMGGRFAKSPSAMKFGGIALCVVSIIIISGILYESDSVEASSGTTGDCQWSYEDKTLTIYGGTYTADYSYSSPQPWKTFQINQVVIQEGVTKIGDYFFASSYDYQANTHFTLPSTLTTIGESAFSVQGEHLIHSNIISIASTEHITTIGSGGFAGALFTETDFEFPSLETLGFGAFVWTNITSIEFGESLTSIGNDAFGYCTSLRTVSISSPITIDSEAFYGCHALYSIEGSEYIHSIGDKGFAECGNLTSIRLDGCNSLGKNAFANCKMLIAATNLNYVPALDATFSGCEKLVTVSGLDEITSISADTFSGCGLLKSLNLGPCLKTIPAGSFKDCIYLENIIVDSNNSYFTSTNGILYNKDKNTLICCPSKNSTSSLSISDGILTVSDYALYNCSNLTSISIGSTLKTLGQYALFGCNNLSSITVSSVNDYFTVYYGILYNYNKSTAICCPAKIYTSSITLPSATKTINPGAFAYCTYLRTISGSVTSVGDYAFYKCTNLSSYEFSNSISKIGNYAFAGCTSISTVYVPSTVTSLGDYAFADCTNINSANICTKTIGAGAFKGCVKLNDLTIANGVTSIKEYAFADCTRLQVVAIPSTTTNISYFSFEGCDHVETYTVSGSNSCYSSSEGVLFSKDFKTLIRYPSGSANLAYTVPDTVTRIASFAFEDSRYLTKIEFSKPIGSSDGDFLSTFEGCSSLRSLQLTLDDEYIFQDTFKGCINLVNLKISGEAIIIYGDPFKNCLSLKNVEMSGFIGNGLFADDGGFPYTHESSFETCRNLESIQLDGPFIVFCSPFKNIDLYDVNGENKITPTTDNLSYSAFHKINGKLVKDKNGLVIKYVYADGTPATEEYFQELHGTEPYSVNSPIITGYTADKLVVSGVMAKAIETFTVTYSPNPYVLTIRYLYTDGTQAHAQHAESVDFNENYSVISPLIEDYVADLPIVAGKMNLEGKTITVTYSPTPYKLTIEYVRSTGGSIADTYEQMISNGSSYSVDSPTFVGYSVDIPTVSGTMGKSDVSFTVTYTPRPYELTIIYEYTDGSIASTEYSQIVNYDSPYSVKSPTIPHYTPDIPDVAGTMDKEGKAITVTYTINKYLLTIEYVYSAGGIAHTTYSQNIIYGDSYSVISPLLKGYDYDYGKIEGTMDAEGKSFKVTYTPIDYLLTIKYVDMDGNELSAAYSEKVAYGKSFSVDSPSISGYVTEQKTVTGTMDGEGKDITVKYSEKSSDPALSDMSIGLIGGSVIAILALAGAVFIVKRK